MQYEEKVNVYVKTYLGIEFVWMLVVWLSEWMLRSAGNERLVYVETVFLLMF